MLERLNLGGRLDFGKDELINMSNEGIKKKTFYSLLFVSGIFAFCYIWSMHQAQIDSSGFMERRVEYLQESLNDFTALLKAANFDAHISKFVYWVVIGHLLGIQDAVSAMYYTEVIWWSLALFIIPILIYKLVGEVKFYLSIILPFITTIFVYPFSHYISDDKWVYAWIVFIGLPILIIIIKTEERQERRKWLILLSFICGIANSLRVWSGITCFIPAILIVITDTIYSWKEEKKIHAVFLLFVILGQLLFSQILIMLIGMGYNLFCEGNINILMFRNRRISPFFQLYIGLGWDRKNEIIYEDASALRLLYESKLDANRTLIEAFFSIVKQNGGRTLLMYLKKMQRSILMSGYYFTVSKYFYYIISCIIQFVGLLFLAIKNKKSMVGIIYRERKVIIIGITCYFISIIPAIIDIPRESTIQGATATLVFGIVYVGIMCVQEYQEYKRNIKRDLQKVG